MTTLEELWNASQNKIDEILAITLSKIKDAVKCRLLLAQCYAQSGMLSPEDITLIKLPEFNKLAEEGLSLKTIKKQLGVSLDLSEHFNELGLASVGSQFLKPVEIQKNDNSELTTLFFSLVDKDLIGAKILDVYIQQSDMGPQVYCQYDNSSPLIFKYETVDGEIKYLSILDGNIRDVELTPLEGTFIFGDVKTKKLIDRINGEATKN